MKDRQSLNDIGHGVLVAGAARPLAGAVTVAFLAWWADTGLAFENPAWPVAWSLPFQILLVLVITSFLGYWRHRVHHNWGFLWPYHALHHSPQQLHVLKGNRLHFGEELVRFLLIPLPLLILGAPAEAILWMTLWSNFSGGLAHSNVDQRFPDWFHYVVPTVHVHSIHHAQEMDHQASNLSPTVCLWDHLFGTFRHPKHHPVTRLGIEGDPRPLRGRRVAEEAPQGHPCRSVIARHSPSAVTTDVIGWKAAATSSSWPARIPLSTRVPWGATRAMMGSARSMRIGAWMLASTRSHAPSTVRTSSVEAPMRSATPLFSAFSRVVGTALSSTSTP